MFPIIQKAIGSAWIWIQAVWVLMQDFQLLCYIVLEQTGVGGGRSVQEENNANILDSEDYLKYYKENHMTRTP